MNKILITHNYIRFAVLACLVLTLATASQTKAQDIASLNANNKEAVAIETAKPQRADLRNDSLERGIEQEIPSNSMKGSEGATILPIYISNFNVIHERDCSATLRWKTNTELGISEFFVEHSTDGITFNVIHSFMSDSKAEGHYYVYNYPYASSGANFFRIRTKDIMIDSNYGPIVRVLVSCFEPAIQAYPNPARSMINIRGAATGQSLQLSNMFGKVMRNQIITNTEPTIDLDGLQPGIYVLVVSNERGEEVTRTRINKQ